MAEINRIKVGETTYDVNTKYLPNIGGYTCLGDGSSSVIIGTNAPYGDKKERKVVIYSSFVDIYDESGNRIKLGSLSSGASASIKGVAVDGDNLIIGTGDDIKNVYLGKNLKPNVILDQQAVKLNGTDIIEIGSIIGYQRTKEDGTLIIGSGACGKRQNIQVGLDDTNISVIGTKVSIKALTIDLPTATKLYFNGIPISKSGNALIFNGQDTELSLDSGWKLTRDKLRVDVVEAYDVVATREFSAKGCGQTCRIGIEDVGSNRGAYMRAHPTSAIDVAHGIEVTPTEILIDDFKFDCDKENSKLIISYNGKKAEIQLN